LQAKHWEYSKGGVSLAAIPDLAAKLKQQKGTLGPIRQYRGFTEAYQDLLNRRVDAVLHNIVSLSVLVNEKPAIFELGERVSRQAYAAWAVKKGNHELLDLLNHFLNSLRETVNSKRCKQSGSKLPLKIYRRNRFYQAIAPYSRFPSFTDITLFIGALASIS
jgi:polar amino acid transport system substrate-binding protein